MWQPQDPVVLEPVLCWYFGSTSQSHVVAWLSVTTAQNMPQTPNRLPEYVMVAAHVALQRVAVVMTLFSIKQLFTCSDVKVSQAML